jgi:protein-L-isoaspartate O-methyltransferase
MILCTLTAVAPLMPHYYQQLKQLKVGGRMIVPVGKQHHAQELLQVDRTEDGATAKALLSVAYVPLVKTT